MNSSPSLFQDTWEPVPSLPPHTASLMRLPPLQTSVTGLTLCVRVCVCVLVGQLCPTLCDPVDCSPPGSSVRGILQARILEWVAIPSPGGLPDSGIEPWSASQADSFPSEPRGKPRLSCATLHIHVLKPEPLGPQCLGSSKRWFF